MVGIIQDPEDVTLDDIREIAEATEQGDLAVAIDRLSEIEDVEYDALDEDEITLPFYEEDRELAFVLGLAVGGVMQANDESGHRLENATPQQQSEDAGDIAETIE